jgi:hypothetical protein
MPKTFAKVIFYASGLTGTVPMDSLQLHGFESEF